MEVSNVPIHWRSTSKHGGLQYGYIAEQPVSMEVPNTDTVWRETFEGENFCELVKNTTFAEKTYADCSLLPHQHMPSPQISQWKLSRIAAQLRNLRKFSPSNVCRYTAHWRSTAKHRGHWYINELVWMTWILNVALYSDPLKGQTRNGWELPRSNTALNSHHPTIVAAQSKEI